MVIEVLKIAVCCSNLLYSIQYHHIHSFMKLKKTLEKKLQNIKMLKFKYLKLDGDKLFFRNGVITARKDLESHSLQT